MGTTRRGRLAIGALTVFTALLIAGCGGSGGSSSPPPTVDDDESSSTTEATSGETSTVTEAISGGTSTVIQPVDAASLDPSQVINIPTQGSTTLSAIYDSLFTVDEDTGAVKARIATDFSSPDGLTWTMTLRPDVTFSDGTTFDASAVKTHWERVAANPRAAAANYMSDITSMTAVDATTFVVQLGTVNRQFHRLVPWSSLGWVPSPTAVAAAGEDFGNQPVGAGPFVLKSRTPNSETVLDRNPTYWQAGLPKLDTLTVRTIPDPQQSYDTIVTGGGQASLSVPDRFALEAQDAGYRTLSTNQVGGIGWLFGTSRAPFTDPRARRAITLAVDMDSLNETVSSGAATVPDSLFPEGTPFHNEANAFPAPDSVEAQRLLDELAAEGTPVKFTIVHTGGEGGINAVAIQTQLAGYDNVEVDVKMVDGPNYGLTLFSGDFDMAAYAFGGDDPEPAMASMRSTHRVPIASMHSDVVDEALQEGREATDEAGRKAAYDKLAKEVNGLDRMLWMNVNKGWAIETPEVTGLVLYGQGTPLFESYGLVG